MNVKTRSLVFATFFGSLIICGLLLISLTSNHWIRSSAKRHNSTEAHGEIYYGLFFGNKDLDVGYGLRSKAVNVYTLIQSEPDIMNYWLWLLTTLGVGFGLFAAAVGAILSVIKSASQAKKRGTMILLFISNSSSCVAQILAFICWIVQFYLHLNHNLLMVEDRNINWTTKNLSYFGYSFWLVILATIVCIINIILLVIAHKNEKWVKRRIQPLSEEKSQTAIMLY